MDFAAEIRASFSFLDLLVFAVIPRETNAQPSLHRLNAPVPQAMSKLTQLDGLGQDRTLGRQLQGCLANVGVQCLIRPISAGSLCNSKVAEVLYNGKCRPCWIKSKQL